MNHFADFGGITAAMTWGFAFCGMFVLDFVWAYYTKAIADNKPLPASVTAVVIILLSGSVVIAYTSNPWLLIPVSFGAFGGTWASVEAKLRGWI